MLLQLIFPLSSHIYPCLIINQPLFMHCLAIFIIVVSHLSLQTIPAQKYIYSINFPEVLSLIKHFTLFLEFIRRLFYLAMTICINLITSPFVLFLLTIIYALILKWHEINELITCIMGRKTNWSKNKLCGLLGWWEAFECVDRMVK